MSASGRAGRLRVVLTALILAALVVVAGLLIWYRPKAAGPSYSGTYPVINQRLFPSPGPELGFRVKVAELGIDLPVVEGDGWTVALYQAAHYPGMKLPGEGGRSMLYAHAQAGMFGPLLHPGGKVGQHVEVDRPGHQPLRYVITQFFASWPPSDVRYLQPADHEELVLLTCTSFDPNGPRVLAVAEPAT